MSKQRAPRNTASLAQRMRLMPHVTLGVITVLPKLHYDGNPLPDRWVLPGRRIVTTKELYAIAERNNWPISIHI